MLRVGFVAFTLMSAAICGRAAHADSGIDKLRRVGDCGRARIAKIETRFGEKLVRPKSNDMDSGVGVSFSNGGYQVSYEFIEAVYNSRAGDTVLICLVSVPKNCPKGDDRGKFYTTTNLRTNFSWTLPDSQHMCGGA